MAAVSVTMTGWANVQRRLRGLPTKVEIEGMDLTKRLADIIVERAKMLVAPEQTGTGALMRSIMAEPTKNGYRVIAGKGAVNSSGVNYARFQEYGFAPHVVRIGKLNPNSRLYRELIAGGMRKNQGIVVARHTSFMGPAFRNAISRLRTEAKRTAKNIVGG